MAVVKQKIAELDSLVVSQKEEAADLEELHREMMVNLIILVSILTDCVTLKDHCTHHTISHGGVPRT